MKFKKSFDSFNKISLNQRLLLDKNKLSLAYQKRDPAVTISLNKFLLDVSNARNTSNL